MKLQPEKESTPKTKGPLHYGGLLLRGLAAGLGLFFLGLMALLPTGPPFVKIPLSVRVWLVTGCFGLIQLALGTLGRWWFGRPFMQPLIVASVVQVLLLFSIRLSVAAEGEWFNPVLFGWPGLMLTLVMPLLGGLLGGRLPPRQPRPLPQAGRVAPAAAAVWVLMEIALRSQITLALGRLTGSLQAADLLAMLLGFPLIAVTVARAASRRDLGRERWALRWNRAAVLSGLAAGLAVLLLLPLTSGLDARLLGQAAAELGEHVAAAPPLWVAALMLVSNGLAVPVAEEVAWRGVVQTGLMDAFGPLRGLLLTAGLFALKHVVVDGSLGRLSTLLLLSLALCLVRWRWGTGASMAGHLAMNLGATALALLAAG